MISAIRFYYSRLSKGTAQDSGACFGVCLKNFGELKFSLGAWKEEEEEEEERKIRRFSALRDSVIRNVLHVAKMHSRLVFEAL